MLLIRVLSTRSSWLIALSLLASVAAPDTRSEAPGRACCGRCDFDRAEAASANGTQAANTIAIAATPRMMRR
jgi:hypothetical protein